MCVPKSVNSMLHPSPPWFKGTSCCCYARTLQNMSVQGCFQHSKVIRVSPTKCCCKHEIRVAPKGRNCLSELRRPTAAVSIHTVCCRLSHLRVAPEDQGLQGFARPVAAASIHMCVAKQIKSGLHPRVDMLQGSGRSGTAVSIHMCAAEQ